MFPRNYSCYSHFSRRTRLFFIDSDFSNEEIRRAPGSGGDVSRILMSLPAVAKINDQTNNLVVRGGSPIENAFYVDNIEIPNINHVSVWNAYDRKNVATYFWNDPEQKVDEIYQWRILPVFGLEYEF